MKERYAGSSLDVNVCHLGEENGIPYAEFEFVPGRPLSELMDECLDRQDVEGFHNLFAEYLERVGYGEDVPVADFDLIFANILVDGDHWTLIDYEWTFDRPIETRALAFRAVYCYVLEDERRNALELDRILDRLGITENEARQYREQEMEFQKYVTGQKLSMGEIRNLLGGEIYKPRNGSDGSVRRRENSGYRSMRTRDRDFPKKILISRRTSMQRKNRRNLR